MHRSEISHFKKSVRRYYALHGRGHLPWRKTHTPYKILVSEIMLQQTQVDRVIPYFTRWMKKFPTVQRLATASLSDVLGEWQGLGYNRRAKLLRACAKEIIENKGGKIPQDFATLVSLPGIGPYTAGAIRAFAFNESEIFIETNIRAALIHHFFPRAKKVPDSKLISILTDCINESESPREWYSALMDYGAHVKKTHSNPSRRSARHTRQTKFEGSLRQMRGEVVRRLTHDVSLASLRRTDAERFEKACQSLIKDGLLERNNGAWRLVA